MQRFIRGLLTAGLVMLAAPQGFAADDPVQPGTRWVGNVKKADPEGKGKKKRIELTSVETTLIVKSRSGKEFSGEMRVGKEKDPRITEIAGTIDEKGVADFRVTERLKGAKADDVVDNRRYHGTFKDDQFQGKWIVPGNDPRGGTIELKLEKPTSK
jgi:hypothetical protein